MRLGQLLLIVVSCFAISEAVRCILGNRLGEYKMVDSLYQCRFAIMLPKNSPLQLIGYPYQVNERGGCFFHQTGMLSCDCYESYCNYRIDKIVNRTTLFMGRQQKKADRDKLKKIIVMLEEIDKMTTKEEKVLSIWRKHNATAQRFVKKADNFDRIRSKRLLIGVGFFIVFFVAGIGYECYNQRRKDKNE